MRPLMKRTALRRRTTLKPGTSSLKRTELKRGGELKRTPLVQGGDVFENKMEFWRDCLRRSELPKVNSKRKAARRLRDFGGPYGDLLIPRLPCCVCFPWWYLKTDEEVREAFADVLFDPERFAVVSEPAHLKSRGAGGHAADLVPLGWDCHGAQHSGGIETFAAAHPTNDLHSTADRMWRLWLTFNVSEGT